MSSTGSRQTHGASLCNSDMLSSQYSTLQDETPPNALLAPKSQAEQLHSL